MRGKGKEGEGGGLVPLLPLNCMMLVVMIPRPLEEVGMRGGVVLRPLEWEGGMIPKVKRGGVIPSTEGAVS